MSTTNSGVFVSHLHVCSRLCELDLDLDGVGG